MGKGKHPVYNEPLQRIYGRNFFFAVSLPFPFELAIAYFARHFPSFEGVPQQNFSLCATVCVRVFAYFSPCNFFILIGYHKIFAEYHLIASLSSLDAAEH